METIVKERMGAYGILIHDEKIALVRKAGGGYKGKLDLPGGGMEHTETPVETLKREIMEEVGIEITNFSLLDVTATNIVWLMEENLTEDLHQIGALYVVESNNLNLKGDADGLDSLGANWYDIASLKKEELTPFTIYSLEKLGYKLS